MSLSSGLGEDIESAAGRADAAAGTLEENALVFEATEDRTIVGFTVSTNQENVLAELSFSNRMLTDVDPSIDETGSGVLAVANEQNSSTVLGVGGDPGITWHAGEELNLHIDNVSSNGALCTVVVHYVPTGDFNRNQLRNK